MKNKVKNAPDDIPGRIPGRLRDLSVKVLDSYEFEWLEIIGRNRTQRLTDCRHLLMSFFSWHSGLSLIEIGEIFGGRDHGTVIHARKKIAKLVDTNPDVAEFIFALEEAYGFQAPSDRRTRLTPEAIFNLPNS